jgi:hypothetical protein
MLSPGPPAQELPSMVVYQTRPKLKNKPKSKTQPKSTTQPKSKTRHPNHANIEFIGPETMKVEIEEEMKKSKDAKKWYHDDIEEELFDAFHTRSYLDERDKERQAARAARQGGCPQTYHRNLECSCSYDMRATNHGYVDRTNWDSDWGAFSAGSD